MSTKEQVMDKLLDLYDWHIRFAAKDLEGEDQYQYGYADAIAQCIINIGEVLGEGWDVKTQKYRPYKYEAYRRVMQYDTTSNYWKKYPTPIASYFPSEVIRRNKGKL